MGSLTQNAYAGQSSRPRLVDLDGRGLLRGAEPGVTAKTPHFRRSLVYYRMEGRTSRLACRVSKRAG